MKHMFANAWGYPPVNVDELDDRYEIQFYAAGYAKSDFQINLNDDTLTVAVEKPEPDWTERDRYAYLLTTTVDLPDLEGIVDPRHLHGHPAVLRDGQGVPDKALGQDDLRQEAVAEIHLPGFLEVLQAAEADHLAGFAPYHGEPPEAMLLVVGEGMVQ